MRRSGRKQEEEFQKYSGITGGVIWKEMLRFLAPIFLGALFQHSYQTVDAIIIGQYAGKEALGAVDATYGFVGLMTNVAMGIASGAAVVIAQSYGAKKRESLLKAEQTILAFMFRLGLLLSVASWLLTPVVCRLTNVPEDIFAKAVSYTRIRLAGCVIFLLYNAGAGILRAVGDTKRPFHYLVVSCLANVLLDLLFVAGLGMDVTGAAVATVLAQALSMCLVLRRLFAGGDASDIYAVRPSECRIDRATLRIILKIGIPIAFQSAMFSVSSIFMQAGINRYGSDVVAGWSINGKLDFLIWMFLNALGVAATTFVAQNYGAGKKERVLRSVRVSVCLAAVIIAAISVLLYFFTPYLARIFISDPDTIALAARMMRLVAPFYVLCICDEVLAAAIKGTGDTFIPMLITMFGICGMRILWILIAVRRFPGFETVIFGYPFTWLVTTILFLIYYLFFVRRRWLAEDWGTR